MKDDFLIAIEQMKKIDELNGKIKQNNATYARLNLLQSSLRKINGRFETGDTDLKIYEINRRKAEIDKLNKDLKDQIKELRNTVCQTLISVYAEVDSDETRARIKSAVSHATDGRLTVIDDEDAGGIFGDCEIVETEQTNDKDKKCHVAKLLSAGLKNEAGRIINKPKIRVYEYTAKSEGTVSSSNEKSIEKIKKQKETDKARTFRKLKERHFFLPLITLLGCGVANALFYISGITGPYKITSMATFGVIGVTSLTVDVIELCVKKAMKGTLGFTVFCVALCCCLGFLLIDSIVDMIIVFSIGVISMACKMINLSKKINDESTYN